MICLDFTRANEDKIEFTGYYGILTANDFTAEIFVKFKDFSDQYLFGNFSAYTSQTHWGLIVSGGILYGHLDRGSDGIQLVSYSCSNLSTNIWYRLSLVSDKGSTVKIHIDSVERGSASDSGVRGDATAQILRVGASYNNFTSSWGAYANAYIADIRLWNVARTPAAMLADYNTRLVGDESGLVKYWKLDEGTGTTVEDLIGSNDGTITGADWAATNISGVLKERESDASGQAYDYLIINRATSAVVASGTASASGVFQVSTGDTDFLTEHDIIMIDPAGTYAPKVVGEKVTGV